MQHTSGKVKSSIHVAPIIVHTLEHEDGHCTCVSILNKQHIMQYSTTISGYYATCMPLPTTLHATIFAELYY